MCGVSSEPRPLSSHQVLPAVPAPRFTTSSWMGATKAWRGSINHQLGTEQCGGPVGGGPEPLGGMGREWEDPQPTTLSGETAPHSIHAHTHPGHLVSRGPGQPAPRLTEPHRARGAACPCSSRHRVHLLPTLSVAIHGVSRHLTQGSAEGTIGGPPSGLLLCAVAQALRWCCPQRHPRDQCEALRWVPASELTALDLDTVLRFFFWGWGT